MSRRLILASLSLVLAAGTGCGYKQTAVPSAPTTTAAAGGPAAPVTTTPCSDGTGRNEGLLEPSYAPSGAMPLPGRMPSGSTMAAIYKRGRLIAGVAADSYLLGFRDTLTSPSVIEGFDIDMVKAIARAIFGENLTDAQLSPHIELRVITPADRIPDLMAGDLDSTGTANDNIDIVARNMTINCTRWQQIAFSSPYYVSGQRLLVARGSGIRTLQDLSGKRACAPAGTTSIDNLKAQAPSVIAVTAANDTGCMVKFQQGLTDAVTTDDTVLAGLAAQDRSAVVVTSTPRLTNEPYGIGVNSGDVDLVQFVNQVLEQMRDDGSWQKSYDTWLRPSLADLGAVQPPAQWGRKLP